MAPEVEEYFPTTETSAENALHQAQKIHKTEHVETEPKDQASSKSHKGRGRPRKKSVVAVDEKPKSTSTKQPSTDQASKRPSTKPLHEQISNEANTPIVNMLHELAIVYFKHGDSGKGIHYQTAAKHIREQTMEIKSGEMTHHIPTIGQHTADHINEFLRTGKVQMMDDLKQEIAEREAHPMHETAVVDEEPHSTFSDRQPGQSRTKPLHEHITNEGNTPIVNMLHELAGLYFKHGDKQKGIHYQTAAKHIREQTMEISSGHMALAHHIETIGAHTADHIDEFLRTGKVQLMEVLKQEIDAHETESMEP
jgi:hypothetical protein